MIFNCLFEDNLREIFVYLNDYIHLKMLQCSSSFFNKGFSKCYIDKYVHERKELLDKYFPNFVVNMLGGYNKALFFPEIINPTMRKRNNFSIPSPKFYEMRYPVMIGVHNNQAFISFIMEHKKTYKCIISLYTSKPLGNNNERKAPSHWETNYHLSYNLENNVIFFYSSREKKYFIWDKEAYDSIRVLLRKSKCNIKYKKYKIPKFKSMFKKILKL